MKTLITVIGVIAFATVAFLLFFNAEIISYTSDFTQAFNFEIPGLYDCAKNYDQLGYWNKNPSSLHFENDALKNQFLAKKSLELWENRCFITVESWAYKSDFEENIWRDGWELVAYTNQLYLGEVEPRHDGEQKMIDNFKFMQEQVDNYP